MTLSKFINPLTISIVGILATVVAAVLIFFLLIQKTLTDLNAQTAVYNTNAPSELASAKEAAENQVTQAQDAVKTTKAEWLAIQSQRNPDIDFSDRMTAWSQYIKELNFTLGPSIEQWLPTTGVKPVAAITTPAAPADPNLVIEKNPIVIPLDGGSPITVIGSFPAILRHIEMWNNFNRIVLIDKLTLAGISPFITATYTATVYEFPQNGDKPGPAVPSSAATAITNGAPPPGGPGGAQGVMNSISNYK